MLSIVRAKQTIDYTYCTIANRRVVASHRLCAIRTRTRTITVE